LITKGEMLEKEGGQRVTLRPGNLSASFKMIECFTKRRLL